MFNSRHHIIFCLALAGWLIVGSSCRSRREAAAKQDLSQAAKTPGSDAQKEYTYGYLYVNGCSERMKGNLDQARKIFEECKKIDPLDPAASYELGTIYKLQNNIQPALENARYCAAASPTNEWYQLLLIDCYNADKQYRQAIKVREALIKTFPAREEFKEDLAIEYALVGEYDKSFKIYEQLEKIYGINEQITLNKVKLLKSQKKNREAEAELVRLCDSDKNETRYYSYLADFYLEQNQSEKARLAYEKIVQQEPLNPGANLALHDYYSALGQDDEAFKYLRRAFDNPELDINTKANILGEYYKNAEQGNPKAFSRGMELAKTMVSLHPSATESNGIFGDFLRLDNKTKEACKYYYLATVNEKRNYRIWRNLLYAENDLGLGDSLEHHSAACMELFPMLPEGYLFNGVANSRLKNYRKAVQSLKDGLEFVNGNKSYTLDFLKALGDAYFNLKEYASSDKAFDDALKIDPDNTYVLNNYAYYLSLRQDDLVKAEKYSKRANDLRANDRSYMDTYGWILYMQKKYAEAEVWIARAAKMGPADAVLLEHYGDVLYRLNKPGEALQQWNAARDAGGSGELLLKKIRTKKLDD